MHIEVEFLYGTRGWCFFVYFVILMNRNIYLYCVVRVIIKCVMENIDLNAF